MADNYKTLYIGIVRFEDSDDDETISSSRGKVRNSEEAGKDFGEDFLRKEALGQERKSYPMRNIPKPWT